MSLPVPPRLPLAEVTRRAMKALIRELGQADAIRFVTQFNTGLGDYTADRDELFAGLSVDDIAAAVRKNAAENTNEPEG